MKQMTTKYLRDPERGEAKASSNLLFGSQSLTHSRHILFRPAPYSSGQRCFYHPVSIPPPETSPIEISCHAPPISGEPVTLQQRKCWHSAMGNRVACSCSCCVCGSHVYCCKPIQGDPSTDSEAPCPHSLAYQLAFAKYFC